MSEIEANDVVVCIDASADPRRTAVAPVPSFIVQGRMYRVSTVIMTDAGIPGIRLVGDPNNEPYVRGAWAVDRFEKIGPATSSFTRVVQACRPKELIATPASAPSA